MNTGVQRFIGRAVTKLRSWDFKNLQVPEPSRRRQGQFLQTSPDQSPDVSVDGCQVVCYEQPKHSLPEPQEQTPTLGASTPQKRTPLLDGPVLQHEIGKLDIPVVDEGTQTHDLELQGERAKFENPVADGETQTYCSELQEDLRYTYGPARIIGAHDGAKKCIALLLTEDMVAKLRQITEVSRKLELAENSFEDARTQATVTELSMVQMNDSLEVTDGQEEVDRITADMEQLEPTLLLASDERDRLEADVANLKFSLESSRAISHDLFERVLEEAHLLAISEPEVEAIVSPPELIASRRNSVTSIQTNESGISLEELNRRATVEELELETSALQRLQAAFDRRHSTYEKELQEWSMEYREGRCPLTRMEFDHSILRDGQQLTRDLIETEAAQEDVLARAWKLGLLQNSWEQESNFIDDIDDGYSLSLEVSMKASVNRDYINAWANGVFVSEPQYYQTHAPESEEDGSWETMWDGQSVGISDSFSVLDDTRNRRRIARWRETCELQHEESECLRKQTMGPQLPERPEEFGTLTRRHSCR